MTKKELIEFIQKMEQKAVEKRNNGIWSEEQFNRFMEFLKRKKEEISRMEEYSPLTILEKTISSTIEDIEKKTNKGMIELIILAGIILGILILIRI